MRELAMTILVLCMTMPLYAATSAAPDVVKMPNKEGLVTFNHNKHVAGDIGCKTCHDRKEGKIRGMGKEWAHKVCRDCHSAIMSGPTHCEGCHDKSKIL